MYLPDHFQPQNNKYNNSKSPHAAQTVHSCPHIAQQSSGTSSGIHSPSVHPSMKSHPFRFFQFFLHNSRINSSTVQRLYTDQVFSAILQPYLRNLLSKNRNFLRQKHVEFFDMYLLWVN